MCEVTSKNFFELYPLIVKQIDESCFLSIDTEFSSIDPYLSSIKTIEQYYKQRSNIVKQITIFQFGLAIFSKTSEQQKYLVNIYNFYLNPPSIYPIDVKYSIQSSSIKFLTEYKFDFNKCFYTGIAFINKTQENLLVNHYKTNNSNTNYHFSIIERNFLNILFEKINKWLITAHLGDQMQYEFDGNEHILADYLLNLELRRCFKTIWTDIQIIENRKILLIEHITKETYEQRLNDNNDQYFESFMESLIGFTKLIRYLKDNYRKPIVGHNCFLDWLLLSDKFLDNLPLKFQEFQQFITKNFLLSIFDTKYLSYEMKDYLFIRQNRLDISNYIDNLTTATSLSSLYDLLTSKVYDNFIFLKPIIEINSTDRYKNQNCKHEAGYDAYMSGVVFLKLIYFYKQKKCSKIDLNDYQSIYDRCLNDIQIYKNRFYSTNFTYISLNRYDKSDNKKSMNKKCLVLQKRNKQKLDMSDIVERFNSYCSMEYEMNQTFKQIYLLFQSEKCQRQILNDYLNDPLYKIEKYNWFKHSFHFKYSFGFSIVITAITLFLLVKRRM